MEADNEKMQFARVDADSIDKLIQKSDDEISKLSEEEQQQLKTTIEGAIDSKTYTVQTEALDSKAAPFLITQPEFMRRMKDMQMSGGGGMNMFGEMPEMYNLVVNTNSPLIEKILETKDDNQQKELVSQALDLAKLSQGLLKGEELTKFVKANFAKLT